MTYAAHNCANVRTLLLATVAVLLVGFSQITHAEEASQETADRWMGRWMSAGKAPSGGLHLLRFKDPYYIVTKPISWKPDKGEPGFKPVTVPKGFVTDFASIPRLFWTSLRPDGDYSYAAVIHDFLYWEQNRSREEADQIFYLVMKDFGISTIRASAIHAAVRTDFLGVGGGPAWRLNSQLKKTGEQRVLSKFPQDPRVTWAKWKKRKSVFK